MATRSPYMSGSHYPTGQAPFSMDLSEQLVAVTQQMVKNRKQEIEDEKLQISDSEKAILTALDFETLQGAGDLFATEHAKRLGELTDKWSKRFKERAGILSNQDMLELSKDKRDVEQKLAVGAAEIKQYADWIKELSNPKQTTYDRDPMLENIYRYVREGKMGTGGLINQAVLRKKDFGEDFLGKIVPLMQKEVMSKESFDTDLGPIDAEGNITEVKSNERRVNEFISWAIQTPDFQEMLKQDKEEAIKIIDGLKKRFLVSPTTESRAKTTASRGPTAWQVREAKSNYQNPYGLKNLTQQQYEGVVRFNEIGQGLVNMDKSSVEAMKSTEYPDVYYDEDALIFVNKKGEMFPVPVPDPNNQDEVNTFKEKIWEFYPKSMKGSGLDKIQISANIVNVDKQFTGEKEQPIKVQNVNSVLEEVKANVTSSGISNLVRAVKTSFPSLTSKIRPFRWGKGIVFNKKDYDFTKPDQIANFETALKEATNTAPKPKTTTESSTEKATLKDPTRMFKLKSGETITAQEYVDRLIKAKVTESEAIKIVNSK